MAESKREPWLPLRWWACLGVCKEVESSHATVWLAGNLGGAWRWSGGACEHALQRLDLARTKATGLPAVPLDVAASILMITSNKLRAVFVRPPRGIRVPIVPWSTASTIAKEWLCGSGIAMPLAHRVGWSPRLGGGGLGCRPLPCVKVCLILLVCVWVGREGQRPLTARGVVRNPGAGE